MKFFLIFTLSFIISNFCMAQTLTPSRLDFGSISSATTRTVTLVNTTRSPLVIRSTASDCNCTSVQYFKKPIAIGDSTVLRITYTPAVDERGVFYKVVKVVLSSQKTPLEFALSGVVIAP